MKEKVEKKESYDFVLAKEEGMHADAHFIVNDELFGRLEEDAVQQLRNVSALPGIWKKALAMPDCHIGYGFPIGGVAAMDRECGCISPGGIGFDINCGVRVLRTNLTKEQVRPKIKELLDEFYARIPCGVGGESKIRLSDEDFDEVLSQGVDWAIKRGYGVEEDKLLCEEEGHMKTADPTKVSPRAKKRGRRQLGTLGAGNHFVEVQVVEEVFDKKVAEVMGFTEPGQIVVMIHSGSRGLGHQVCSDYLRRMEDEYPDIVEQLPEKDLIYAPAQSEVAQDYWKAMSAAANYAWTNRHMMGHHVREAITQLFPEAEVHTVYDVAHNICKEEEYELDGEKKKVWVHRKGATRAFGPGHPEIPEKYREIGQPILLPGSMGTASYVLAGSKKAEQTTFASTAHGAGRVMSRFKAKQQFQGETVKEQLERQEIFVKAATMKGISEEAPDVYKNVHEVVNVLHDAGIGTLVVRVKPLGVIKG